MCCNNRWRFWMKWSWGFWWESMSRGFIVSSSYTHKKTKKNKGAHFQTWCWADRTEIWGEPRTVGREEKQGRKKPGKGPSHFVLLFGNELWLNPRRRQTVYKEPGITLSLFQALQFRKRAPVRLGLPPARPALFNLLQIWRKSQVSARSCPSSLFFLFLFFFNNKKKNLSQSVSHRSEMSANNTSC